MGSVINACKSTITSKSTPETINETHLENDDKAYQHQRKFEDEFLKNTEDLIQEITTNSNWQHHETRYLLSQFRRLGEKKGKETTNLSSVQFTQFLPTLIKRFISIQDAKQFETNKLFAKWLKHLVKLFSNNDEISFQSFANMLSTACRGDNMERAELLFNIFDVDGDDAFNQNELHLFLLFIFNIDCDHNEEEHEHDDDNETTSDKKDTLRSSPNINKIIIRTQFIDYIQDLISPKVEKTSEIKPVTNGLESTQTQNDTKGEQQIQTNEDENENVHNITDDPWDENENNKDKESPTSNTKSSEKADSEWEQVPLNKQKHDDNDTNDDNDANNDNDTIHDEDITTNIDFLGSTTLQDLKTADDETLSNILKKLLKEKLYIKHKLKRKRFIQFACRSIDFDHLFDSFMIIPTRDDERKIIKQLMSNTEMRLGASWFVLSKEWWDKWCLYTGYNDSDPVEKLWEAKKEDDDDDAFIDATNTTKRAMRPIKISNRDLLNANSIYSVLKKGQQENNEFILLPEGAWEQLHEWYGGGPSIERYVVCTNKEVRMKEIKYTLDRLRYEYLEQKRMDKEAMKKKKNRQRSSHNNRNNDDDKHTNGVDSDDGSAFDIERFNKEYPLFLEELSMTVNRETLRIDLHPIYCTFMVLNEKTQIPDHAERELMISRYASLPELYINICARSGYHINDIEIEKKNYLLYLENKREAKSNERNKGKNEKKNKKKDKDTHKIALPPRLWSLRHARNGLQFDGLLYPIPKFIRSKEKETTPKDTPKKEDKAKTDSDTNESETDKDKTSKADDAENNNNDATQVTEKGDKETEDENNDDDNEENDTINDDKAASDKSHDDSNEEEEDLDDDDIDLQTIGLQSGICIAVEFAHPNRKKSGALQYNRRCVEEDAECEPEIGDEWLSFEVGDMLDCRDRWGKWYEATIKYHKKQEDSIPKKPPLSASLKKRLNDGDDLASLEAIFIHYTKWEDKWDEWIYIDVSDTLCRCRNVCNTEKTQHRIAAHMTQSKFKASSSASGRSSANRSSGRYSSRYAGGGYDNHDRWSGGRGRESVRGAPSTAGCVGLVNLGNTCFMNSIIQCVSNTPHFRTFFTSGQYKPDINKTNPLGMKGELANEFAKLVSDVWSGSYKVIAPRSLKHKLSKFAPQFSGWQQHDSQEFLTFLLDGLHEDLNLVQSKPYTDKIESNGRSDKIVADLAWKIYLKRNKSKIVDLFQAQQKSHVICPDCARNSITFNTYMYLSVPIVGHSSKSLIVDVFHRKISGSVNKPTRHIFHVNKYQKVRDLAQMVAKCYDTKNQFVLFYENWNMKVAREYDHNLMLGMVPDRDALGCYILKDWNEEVTPQEIKKKKLSLQIAKVCHCAPLTRNGKLSANNGPLFGMPFVISFLNIHTRREVHRVIYERLFMWIGADVLVAPPTIKKKDTDNDTENDTDTDAAATANDDDDDDDEAKWDKIFSNLPYKLRLMPYRHYSLHSSKAPEQVPIDDVVFETKIRNNKDIDIIVEWNEESHAKIKGVVNKVVVDQEYSKWKKDKQAKTDRSKHNKRGGDQLTLYDCINAYVAQETLGENDLWYCSECKKHQQANKKLDLWSFPEILVIHLKRFQVLSMGRFGRGEKISTFVDCPIRGLDLTPYVIDDHSETTPIYDLYAVSCHSGSCGGGHYTAYALNDETDRWYYFNDSSVRPAKESDIVSNSTYVLFYKKCH